MFLLLFLALLPFSICEEFNKITPEESDELKKSCGLRPLYDPDQMKIYGGHKAKEGQFPWAVEIHGLGGCGGSLITKRHILTAAHCTHMGVPPDKPPCFKIKKPEVYSVWIGGLKTASGKKFGIKALTSFPLWSTKENQNNYCSLGGDLAIYELDQDVPVELIEQGKIGFGCLPSPDTEYGKHKLVAHGWGLTLNTPTERDLMWAYMFPLEQGECNSRADGRLPNGTICVAEVNSDVCAGDSGGPLLQISKHRRFRIMGVVSYGTRCEVMKNETVLKDIDYKEYDGGVFTDVRYYLDWICEKTGACYTLE